MTRPQPKLSLWTCGLHSWWAPRPRDLCPYAKCKSEEPIRFVRGPWRRQQTKKATRRWDVV